MRSCSVKMARLYKVKSAAVTDGYIEAHFICIKCREADYYIMRHRHLHNPHLVAEMLAEAFANMHKALDP